MKQITIIHEVETKREHSEYVLNELKKLVIPTILEQGCMQYDLYMDLEYPNKFVLYETWKCVEDYETHVHNLHVVNCIKQIREAELKYTYREMLLVK